MTSNIVRRLKEHNQCLSNTLTTKNISDFRLLFCQIAKDREEARKLEKFLKSGFGRELRSEIVEL